MDISKDYAVQMRGIKKSFGSFCALDDVHLDVKKGTIHSILGENGAGKSTLMNILYGFYHADAGEIYINGESVNIKHTNVAIDHGIGMVHQHFMLVDKFTVTQNIILGSEVTNKLGVLNMNQAKKNILDIIDKYGLKVDPDAKIRDISVGMQQRVEILKALYRGVDLLILDEPTAVLTPQEIEDLISIMHNLINDGKTIIIITHKLEEIKASSDVCTIIRRGKYIDTVNVNEINKEELANKMVGRAVKLVVEKTPAQPGPVIFEIDKITVEDHWGIDKIKNLSLQIRKGEILGIAGIDGNGQKELVEAIHSLIKVKSGSIKINDKHIENTNAKNVIESKISTIPEDRHKMGIILDFSVIENSVIERYNHEPYSKRKIMKHDTIKKFTEELIENYDIRPKTCTYQPIRQLSGGNQQKVVIAREIANNPDLLIAVQPTRGLDVGAIEYVHSMLVKERDEGKAILLISLELDEIMHLSDKIAVIYDGTIVDTFTQGEADEKTIGFLMAGGKQNAKNA